jgi:uncharacterized protein (DUF1778 family)
LYGALPYNIQLNERSTKMAKTARVEARLSPDTHTLVKRAAEIQGRSVSDFIVAAAQDAARKAVAEAEIIHLAREAQEHVVAMLLNPPAPTPSLARAFARHRALIAE